MMKRRLVFDGDGEKAEKRFQFCLQALLGGGGMKDPRTKEIVRQEAHLLDAFDSISVAAPVDEDKDHRTLRAGTGDANGLSEPLTLLLPQPDFALLAKYVDTMPWLPRASREAVDVMDWLSAAEKIEE